LSIGEAFPFFVSIVDNETLTVTFQPAPEHYLYQHRFGFAMRGSDGASEALDYSLPEGLEKTDQFFGDIVSYYDTVTATLPVAASGTLDGKTLIIEFQGCADWGLCYPWDEAVRRSRWTSTRRGGATTDPAPEAPWRWR